MLSALPLMPTSDIAVPWHGFCSGLFPTAMPGEYLWFIWCLRMRLFIHLFNLHTFTISMWKRKRIRLFHPSTMLMQQLWGIFPHILFLWKQKGSSWQTGLIRCFHVIMMFLPGVMPIILKDCRWRIRQTAVICCYYLPMANRSAMSLMPAKKSWKFAKFIVNPNGSLLLVNGCFRHSGTKKENSFPWFRHLL